MIESITAWFRSVFAAPSPATRTADWRLRLVRLLLGGALVVGLLALGPAINFALGAGAAVAVGLLYILLSILVVLRAEFPLQLLALVLIVYALGLADLLGTGDPAGAIFYFLLSILFATLLWSLIAGVVVAAASLLTLGIAGVWMQFGGLYVAGTIVQPAPLTVWITSVIATLIASVAVIAGLQQVRLEFARSEKKIADAATALQTERSTLEQRVDDRTLQWRTVLEVGRVASSIHDPEELTSEIVNLISDRFGFYYAAIFLLNEAGDKAELHSATGEAGRLLIQNRHSLPVGGKSMVGTAVSTRQARVALDTDTEAVRFANPLLPYTRSEIAVPLLAGDRVLGALDVQSTSPNAFGPSEIETFQGVANLVAIAFENARLYQDSRRSLEELQAVQRQYILSAWQPLSDRRDLQYSLGDEEHAADGSRIEVPLALRDQIIGEINLSAESDWTPEQRNLVEAIATQAALALENARLVEATQSTAQREHLLAEITGKVWSSAGRDGILRTALGELGRALGAEGGGIELAADEAQHPALAFVHGPRGLQPAQPGALPVDQRSLRTAIEFRGRTIGYLYLTRSMPEFWSESDRDLARKTADQVALSLENVRLLEETRDRALQEQTLSEFSARLSQSVDLDTLLQTAVREIASLPDVADASIYLSPSPSGGEPDSSQRRAGE